MQGFPAAFELHFSIAYITETQKKLQAIIAIITHVRMLMLYVFYISLNRLNLVVMFNQCACQMTKLFSPKDLDVSLLDGEKPSPTTKKVPSMSLICLFLGNFVAWNTNWANFDIQ